MNRTIWQRKIPTLLGIAIIIAGIALTSFFTKRGVPFIGKASLSETPENIRITNITDSSFTISYTTASEVLGSITYGQSDKMENTAIDNEDKTTNVKPRTIHTITVTNLSSKTTYFFSIVSGETTFLENGKPFSVVTGPTIQGPSPPKKMRGTFIFPQNSSNEALVYVVGQNTQMLSTKVKSDGIYSFNLENMRTEDLTSFASLSPTDVLTILVIEPTAKSHVTLFANQIDPVPTVILSKNYDFTIQTNPIATPSGTLGFPILLASPSAKQIPQIINPAKDESFTDQKPQFRGSASPSADVEIEIHSDEQIKTKVVADKNGAWTYRPQTPLSEGVHTITIKTRDQFGILKTITQTFTVYAQGTQVRQSATPSATLTPTKTPTTPTPTPIQSGPTPTKPMPTPTTTVILPPIEPPGTSSTLPLAIGAFGIVTAGFMLLLRLRKETS